jgi:hypothetical protein
MRFQPHWKNPIQLDRLFLLWLASNSAEILSSVATAAAQKKPEAATATAELQLITAAK